MIYLLLSILFSSVTVSFFKVFELKKVNTFQAIIFNYLTCGIIGNLLAQRHSWDAQIISSPWILITLALGFLFISIFYCIALTAQRISVSASMVAAKLSVVVPVLMAWILYHEELHTLKLIGIVVSLLAVYFISRKNETSHGSGFMLLLLPALVFMGSGAIDTLLGYLTQNFVPAFQVDEIVTSTFVFAFLLGSVFMLFQVIKGKERLEPKSVLWGFLLGLPNYFSMYFLGKTLEAFSGDQTYIFPINNIGIVALSTLIAYLAFAEKLNKQNKLGLLMALLAIVLISLNEFTR